MKTIDVPEMEDVDLAFGSIKHLPKWSEIPEEFRKDNFNANIKWTKAAQTWFYSGIKKSQFIQKEGINKDKAMRALGAILCSWEPKQEHKIAGVAYLMSQWFDDFKEGI